MESGRTLYSAGFTQFPSRKMNPFGSKLLGPFVCAISESPNEAIRLEIALNLQLLLDLAIGIGDRREALLYHGGAFQRLG